MKAANLGRLQREGDNNFHLIRLLAALAVIYGHAYPIVGAGGADLYLQWVGNKFIGGVAVDVFFIVSGFLIAGSLERSSWRRYLWARGLRLLPALWVSLFLTVFVMGPLLTVSADYFSDPQTWRYLWANASLWRTEYMLPGVFGSHADPAVNGSLWSLPVEGRLYLVFLMLSLLGLLKPARYGVFVVVAWMSALVLVPQMPVLQQYANWVGAAGFFAAGALMWTHRDSVLLSIWGVLGSLGLCVALKGTPGFAVAYFAALVYLVFYCAYAVRLPVIRERDLSYGVYLYGWPVQQLVVHAVPSLGPLMNTVVACLICLLLAWGSWEWIERPALSLKNRLS